MGKIQGEGDAGRTRPTAFAWRVQGEAWEAIRATLGPFHCPGGGESPNRMPGMSTAEPDQVAGAAQQQ